MNPERPEFDRGSGRGGGCGSSGNTQHQQVNGFYGTSFETTVNERASINMSLPSFSYTPTNDPVIVDKHKLAHDKLKKKLYDRMVLVNNTNIRSCYKNVDVAPLAIKQEIMDCKSSYCEMDGYSSVNPQVGSFYSTTQSNPMHQNLQLTSSQRHVAPQMINRIVSTEATEVLKPHVQLPKADFNGVVFQRQMEGSNVLPSKINSIKFVVPPAELCSFQNNKAQDTSKFQQTTLPSSSLMLAQGLLPRMHDASSSHPTRVPSGISQQQLYNKEIHLLQQYHHQLEKKHSIQHEHELQQQRYQNQIQVKQVQQHQLTQQKSHLSQVQQQRVQRDENFHQIPHETNHQHQIKQEASQQHQMQQDAQRQHQIQKANHNCQIQQEANRQHRIKQEADHQCQIQQEADRQCQIQQEANRQYQMQQEANHQCQIQQETNHQLQLQQERNHQHQIQQEANHQHQIHQEANQRQHEIKHQCQLQQDANRQHQIQERNQQHQMQQEENHQHPIQQEVNRQHPIEQERNHQHQIQHKNNSQHLIQQKADHQHLMQQQGNHQHQIQQERNHQHQTQPEVNRQQQVHPEVNRQQQVHPEVNRQHQIQQERNHQQQMQQEANRQHQMQQEANRQHQMQQEANHQHQIQQTNRQHQIQEEVNRQHQIHQETNSQLLIQQKADQHQLQQEANCQHQIQQERNHQHQTQSEVNRQHQIQQERNQQQMQQEANRQHQMQQEAKCQRELKQGANRQHPLQQQVVQQYQMQQKINCQPHIQRPIVDYRQLQLQQPFKSQQRGSLLHLIKQEINQQHQTQHHHQHQIQQSQLQYILQQDNCQNETQQKQKQQEQNYVYKPKYGSGVMPNSSQGNLNHNTAVTSVYTMADCIKTKRETVVMSQSRQNVISFGNSKLSLPPSQPRITIESKSTFSKMPSGKPPCSIRSPLPITISMLKKPKMNEGTPAIDLNSDVNERLELLKNNIKMEAPPCECFKNSEFIPDRAPYYTHLGYGSSLPHLRQVLEERFELKGEAIRIEKLSYTGREGKTSQGCPIAKWIIRRSGPEEKVLVLAKHRPGHHCETAWLVIVTVAWEGVPSDAADDLYTTLVYKLTNFGLPTTRRCGINEQRTCACQGLDNNSGASFSFGCSWSMYYNGCKFARSKNIRKFRLSETSEENEVEEKLQSLATNLAPVYQKMAPDSYQNQITFEEYGTECRLGRKPGRPWSGVTACVDFCAHSHKDLHNMNNGCTVVVTLTKHRGFAKPDDEQLHVLPLYVLEPTDEFGSEEGQLKKMADGSLEILRSYPMELRIRKTPLTPCRRRGKKRKDESTTPNSKEKNGTQAGTVEGLPVSQLKSTPEKKACQSSNFNHNFKRPILPLSNTISQLVNASELTQVKPDLKMLNKFDNLNNNNINSNVINVEAWKGKLKRELYTNTNTNQEVLESSGIDSNVFQSPLHLLSEAASIKCRQYDDQANTATLCDPNGNSVKLLFSPVSTPEPSANKKLPDFVASPRLPSPVVINNNNNNNNNNNTTNVIKFGAFPAVRAPSPQSLLISPTHPNNKINRPTSTPASHTDVSHLVPSPNPETITRINNHNQQTIPRSPKVENIQEKNVVLQYFPFFNDPAKGVSQPFCLPSLFNPNYSSNVYGTSIKEEPLDLIETEYATPPPSPSHVNEGYYEIHSENEENFSDESIGGVAIALSHGSVLFECAKHELHATTALKHPSRLQPTRISLVFYQHKNLNLRDHGEKEYERKMELKRLEELSPVIGSGIPPKKRKKYEEAIPNTVAKLSTSECKVPTQRLITGTTTSWVTVFPFAPLIVTGPYQKWI